MRSADRFTRRIFQTVDITAITVAMSFAEIYRGDVYDLLAKNTVPKVISVEYMLLVSPLEKLQLLLREQTKLISKASNLIEV